jgi:hypothetical protein
MMRATDYAVVRILTKRQLQKLAAEVRKSSRRAAQSFRVEPSKDGRITGFSVEMADGGRALDSFLTGKKTLAVLKRLTGLRWRPRNTHGRYTLYRRPSHYFGVHRDVKECEITVITCIRQDAGPGGDLVLYPERSKETVRAIARSSEKRAVRLRLAAGESLVMRGTVIAHRVTPMGRGQTRITEALCYSQR